jgi:formamidopyrimidine-DNA glycosylase
VRLASPFLLRTVAPPLAEFEGRRVAGFERLGKRIVFAFEGELFLVLHLMIAGRLRWRERGAPMQGKVGLAAFDFETVPRCSPKPARRSARRCTPCAAARPCGARPRRHRRARLRPRGVPRGARERESHAQARADRSAPVQRHRQRLFGRDPAPRAALAAAVDVAPGRGGERAPVRGDAAVLVEWTERLRAEVGEGFPEKVTAFREGMAVHGRFGEPCPVCGAKVQRIAYADNEANYCARCQTGGRLLADRALSRLLKQDWPKTLDELEELRRKGSR